MIAMYLLLSSVEARRGHASSVHFSNSFLPLIYVCGPALVRPDAHEGRPACAATIMMAGPATIMMAGEAPRQARME